jgi:uncharacterized protein DUF4328
MDPRYKSPTANVDIEVEQGFRDIEQLTNVVKWMFWIGALFWTIAILSSLLQIKLVSSPFTIEAARFNDQREAAINGLTLIFKLATLVVFWRWIYVAHRNLPALGVRYLEVTPGWAVGWFFIPFLNLWYPFKGMRFLWRASHSPQAPDQQDGGWEAPTWWILYLACALSPFLMLSAIKQAQDAAGIIAMTQFQIFNRVLNIAVCVAAALLVTRIWHAQREQHENPVQATPAGFADT